MKSKRTTGRSSFPARSTAKPGGTSSPGTQRHSHPGQPQYYDTPEQMQAAIDDYFARCDHDKRPYTIVGLALSLGFCERKSLLDYQGKPEFLNTIKSAKLRVEEQRNQQLLTDNNAAGKIFDLKNNFGWIDKTEHDVKVAGVEDIWKSMREKNGEGS